MAVVKKIGRSGQISLGKEYAGRDVLIEKSEDGVWIIKTGRFIPDNERWLHESSVSEDLDAAINWAKQTPPSESDLDELENLGTTIKTMSRCGLGQTAANPVLTTLKNLPEIYRSKTKKEEFIPQFQIEKALADGIEAAGREPVWEEEL